MSEESRPAIDPLEIGAVTPPGLATTEVTPAVVDSESVATLSPCTTATPPIETAAVPLPSMRTSTPASSDSVPTAALSWSTSWLALAPLPSVVTIDWLSSATWESKELTCSTWFPSCSVVFVWTCVN